MTMPNNEKLKLLGCEIPQPRHAPGDDVFVASSPEFMNNEDDIPVFKGYISEVRYSVVVFDGEDEGEQDFKIEITYQIQSMLDTLVREEAHVHLSHAEALIEAGSLVAKFVAKKNDALNQAKELSGRILASIKEESSAIRS